MRMGLPAEGGSLVSGSQNGKLFDKATQVAEN